jgi:hypothetical protein
VSDEDVRHEAERELGDRPGVVAVALGYKVRGGEMTDVPALRIYVEEKKPAADLAPEELVPPEFGGMPTDVLEPPQVVEDVDATPCAERAPHSTLTGGITISTLKQGPDGKVELGTLGFMATIPGATPPHDIALVTNNHVIVGKAGGREGDTVYQPKWARRAPDGSVGLEKLGADTVGTVLKLADKKDDLSGSYVDAASVKLDICISSWCNSNCRLSFNKDIQGLAIGGRNDIHDVSNTVAMGEVVVKVGRTTGRTVGTVTGVHVATKNPDGVLVHDNIEVTAVSMQDPGNCGGPLRFSDSGDSGSALIDSQRNLIGLHWGHHDTLVNVSYSCHIRPVLTALGVVPITELHPVHGNPAAEGMSDDASAVIDAGPDRRAELRGAFLATPAGRDLAAEAERHRHEVVHLVNHVRRVTITWHRNQGPAYLNRLIANARDPGVPIPHEIEGITRARLLDAMADVLSAHGSAELTAAIALRREEALARTADVEDLQQLVDDLAGARVA